MAIMLALALFGASGIPAQEPEGPGTPQTSPGPGPWPAEEEIEHLRTLLAYTLDPGEVEVNLVAGYARLDRKDLKSDDGFVRVELEVGLRPDLMIEVEYSYLRLDPDGAKSVLRPGDVEVEAKYALVRRSGLAVGVGASLGAVWERSEGEREPAAEIFLAAAWELSERLRAHLTLGGEAIRDEPPERFLQSALEVRPLGPEFILQLGIVTQAEGGDAPATALIPGFFIRFDEEFKLGVGVPVGLSDAAEEWGILLNLELEVEF